MAGDNALRQRKSALSPTLVAQKPQASGKASSGAPLSHYVVYVAFVWAIYVMHGFFSTYDFVCLALAAIMYTIFRFLSDAFFFKPLAKAFGIVNTAKSAHAKKLSEAGWKCVNWSLLVAVGLYACLPEDFFWDDTLFWTQHPDPVQEKMRIYYMMEIGWYLHSQFYLMFLERETGQKRKDFWEMTIHHFATINLVSMSYLAGFSRVGAMIMLAHDVVDIPLELALFTKEMGLPRVTDIAFATLAVFWVVFRLVIFPFHLLRSAFVTSYSHCPPEIGYEGPVMEHMGQHWMNIILVPNTCYYLAHFFPFTILLVGLHVYWFYLIVKMIIRAVSSRSVGGDIRDEQ